VPTPYRTPGSCTSTSRRDKSTRTRRRHRWRGWCYFRKRYPPAYRASRCCCKCRRRSLQSPCNSGTSWGTLPAHRRRSSRCCRGCTSRARQTRTKFGPRCSYWCRSKSTRRSALRRSTTPDSHRSRSKPRKGTGPHRAHTSRASSRPHRPTPFPCRASRCKDRSRFPRRTCTSDARRTSTW
jgi:hypothetical protein